MSFGDRCDAIQSRDHTRIRLPITQFIHKKSDSGIEYQIISWTSRNFIICKRLHVASLCQIKKYCISIRGRLYHPRHRIHGCALFTIISKSKLVSQLTSATVRAVCRHANLVQACLSPSTMKVAFIHSHAAYIRSLQSCDPVTIVRTHLCKKHCHACFPYT